MTKLAPQEAKITDWLASQKEAMLALLGEVVNIDSGSYDKSGVDAVGVRFMRFFQEQGLLTTIEPHERFGDAIHIRLDDKPSNERPIVLMGHRDTVFPQGRGGAPAVPHRRRPRLRPRRRRHEGRARAQRLRAGGLQALRRRAGPARRPHHQRRGDRLAVLAPRDRARRASGALRVQLRARPSQRQHRHLAQGRRVPRLRDHGQGRPLRRQLREGHQRHRRDGAQDRRHAQADRPEARHHRQCRSRQGRAIRQYDGAASRRGRSTCATSSPSSAAPRWRPCSRSSTAPRSPAPRAKLEIRGEFLPVSATPEAEELFGTYQAAAADAGLRIAGEFSGGCADSGFTSAVGCPTLCGVGPVGANAHTPEEYLEVETLVPRAQAMALAILRLPATAERA